MPVFYFHSVNSVAKKLAEMTNQRGFLYTNRGELDFKLQGLISDAGYDVWPQFHTVVGSLAGSIDKHIPLDPDDELDRHTIKICHSSQTPWSFIKIHNGPKMSCVVGYCSTPASSPFNMTTAQMAQKGIIHTSVIPRAS